MLTIEEISINLSKWFIRHKFQGHDPYQLNRIHWLWVKYTPWPRLALSLLEPLVIPKALGLIIRGNVAMYRKTGENYYLQQCSELIEILIRHRWAAYKALAWGWPFEWTSGLGLVYPKGWPLAVVSAEIGHAFMDYYEVSSNPEILRLCGAISLALTDEIGFTRIGSDMICFHYTSLDKYFVNNVNVYVASYLARLGQHCSKDDLVRLAWEACQYTIQQQTDEGGWYYYAPPFLDRCKVIDNRHTGFTITALSWANKIFNDSDIGKKIQKGWMFYKRNFIEGTRPKWNKDNLYPIDMHNIAQTIITATEMGESDLALDVVRWAVEHMSNHRDEFYYRMDCHDSVIRLPFFRWCQAWMYWAMSWLLYSNASSIER